MYLGPLSMDYTGAVAKETRYIVSLDRLVKKQHIWGFHQGLMMFRGWAKGCGFFVRFRMPTIFCAA